MASMMDRAGEGLIAAIILRWYNPWLNGYLNPPLGNFSPKAGMVVKQTPVANGPKVPMKASVRMAETSGLSVSGQLYITGTG